MNKIILATAAALALTVAQAKAETATGEIISIQDDIVTLQTKDGQQMSFKTSDGTTYRKKTLNKHHKKKRGMRGPADWTYEPIAEEDDWVEIVYNPKTGTGDVYEVDTITVYDD
ncbi:MAG: hypothetical protein II938_02930 [Alphaproteobacteria bacterium]|nr:hypothetical protein [Alphaproteobacteria bacterium]